MPVKKGAGGVKGVKMARMDLIPMDALWEVSKVYGKGAEKYEDRNWEHGFPYGNAYGAALRHIALAMSGQDIDEESGLPHEAHAAWMMLALLSFKLRGIGEDDRGKGNFKAMTAEVTNPEIWDAKEDPTP